jgi:hypothetical protein
MMCILRYVGPTFSLRWSDLKMGSLCYKETYVYSCMCVVSDHPGICAPGDDKDPWEHPLGGIFILPPTRW